MSILGVLFLCSIRFSKINIRASFSTETVLSDVSEGQFETGGYVVGDLPRYKERLQQHLT